MSPLKTVGNRWGTPLERGVGRKPTNVMAKACLVADFPVVEHTWTPFETKAPAGGDPIEHITTSGQ